MYVRKLSPASPPRPSPCRRSLYRRPRLRVYTPDPDDPTFTPVAGDLDRRRLRHQPARAQALADAYNATAARPARLATLRGDRRRDDPPAERRRSPDPTAPAPARTCSTAPRNNTDVDFARSSSALSAAESAAGLQAFPFALDTLVMAVSDTVAVARAGSLTPAPTRQHLQGHLTNWSDVPGSAASTASSRPKIPQAGSGTRSFFAAQLKPRERRRRRSTLGRHASAEVQEHEPAPRSRATPTRSRRSRRAAPTCSAPPLRVEEGFSANRALYNVVRGADVGTSRRSRPSSARDGYVCSTAARPLIEAGRLQAAGHARPTAASAALPTQGTTSNFTLNEQVGTATTLTVTSTTPGQAKLTAVVTGSTSPQRHRVASTRATTLLASGVPLISGQAVRRSRPPPARRPTARSSRRPAARRSRPRRTRAPAS